MSEQQDRSNQLPAVMEKLVEHQRLLTILSVSQLQWVFENPKDAMRIFSNAIISRLIAEDGKGKLEQKLLEPTGVSLLVPACGKFIAAEKLVIDTSETARVRISYLGDNFKEWFGEKVEENFAEAELKLSKLRKKSVDKPIMHELGDKCEISLYGFYETLAYKQAKGDLSWTVGYATDVNGVRRAVGACWYGVGWLVDAIAVDYPSPWFAGDVVVSR